MSGSTDLMAPLAALCAIARFHQIAADPATLAHQLGLASSEQLNCADLLRAAKHLGLKAKRTSTTVARLGVTPLPALALMRTDDALLRVVILAQSDGKRVLYQDVSASPAPAPTPASAPAPSSSGATPASAADTSGRPTIVSAEVFAAQWTGDLILILNGISLEVRPGEVIGIVG
ncbi:MAG: cysteine peptidase family C39 domain-containing protein, partial [Burkholderiaceae bacterium]